jgi:hypothetical protein
MVYTGKVMVTEEGDVEDIAIAITAEDDAGNTGTASDAAGNAAEAATVMVTLDNTAPVITAPSRGDEMHVMAGDMVTISAMVTEASTVSYYGDA